MRRGTTPTLRVTVDADITEYKLYLALKTRGKLIVKSDELEVSTEAGDKGTVTVIICRLTQEDTLAMQAGQKCEVQIRAVDKGGATALASNIDTIPVERILQDGVLDGE